MVGMIAFAFRKLSVRALLLWALGLLAFDILFMAGGAWHFFTAEAAARAPGAGAAAIAEWRETSSEFAVPSGAVLAHELALFRGPWLGIVHEQLTKGLTGPLFQLLFGSAETLGYMLLGMAGLRSGFLKGEWADSRYRRIALWTLGLSIPAYAAMAWILYRSGFAVPVFFLIFFVAAAPFRLAMMAGYAALIILVARRRGWVVQRIAAAGRAAFTNYLGSSLIASAIFYGWGLGLYGTLSRLEAWLVVPLVWALILLWSKPWLDRFRYGPFEWLWRSLARLSPQPLRRRQGAPA
jgi:uncharacterized protein